MNNNILVFYRGRRCTPQEFARQFAANSWCLTSDMGQICAERLLCSSPVNKFDYLRVFLS